MLGLLGKKLGQTRVYDEKGVLRAVTVVLVGPNRVLQVKTEQTDGYNAVQLGFDDQKEQRLAKPLLGHIKKHNGAAVKRIREFRDFTLSVKPGDVVSVEQTPLTFMLDLFKRVGMSFGTSIPLLGAPIF